MSNFPPRRKSSTGSPPIPARPPSATSPRPSARQGRRADRPQAPAEGAGGRGPSGEAAQDLPRSRQAAAGGGAAGAARPTTSGDLFCKPLEWHGEGPEPRICSRRAPPIRRSARGRPHPRRLQEVRGEDHQYEARLIRRIGTNPRRILGVFRKGAPRAGASCRSTRAPTRNGRCARAPPWRAKDGELVEAEQAGPKGAHGPAAGAHRRAAGRSRRAEGRQPDRDP
jgi:hypothetical protein